MIKHQTWQMTSCIVVDGGAKKTGVHMANQCLYLEWYNANAQRLASLDCPEHSD